MTSAFKRLSTFAALSAMALLLVPACSSTGYKTQGYARLSNTKEFEDEFPVVWKAAVTALADYKIDEKDQDKGLLVTDWIYSTSNEKYVEYQVNGFPRKHYLQSRYKYRITLERGLGKVKVTVAPQEELENIKSDGTADGWNSNSDFDSQRANEMLKNIELKILSMPDALKPQN